MASNIQRIIDEFKRKHLAKYSLVIPDDWLSQCAEFLTVETPGKLINEYTDLIFSQLLDYDLNIIGTESNKANFLKTSSGILNGSFFLQLKYCIDTTESSFCLIQKLRGIISENAQVDADNVSGATQFEQRNFKKNRMLAIYLTDGKNSITAIENKFIPDLKDDLFPGVKIEISGSIPFENNILLLEPQHVRVLGGFVEEIANLDHMLHLIEEDIKKKFQQKLDREKSKSFDNEYLSNQTNKNSNYQIKNQMKSEKSSQIKFKNLAYQESDEDEMIMNCDLTSFKPTNQANSLENSSFKRPPSTDEISNCSKSMAKSQLKKQKVNEIIVLEGESGSKNLKDKKSFRNLIEDDDDIKFLQIDESNLNTNKFVNGSLKNEFRIENKENFSSNSDDFDMLLNNSFDKDKKAENSITKLSTLMDSTFLNLCCMKNRSIRDTLATCSHVSKCFFVKVVSNLKQFKLKWYQDILVSDGIAEMSCYIDNEPLADLLDLTCQEAKELFIKAKETSDNKYQQIFEQKRKNCEQKLKKITALMHLKYNFDNQKFCIFKMENIEYNRA